MFFRACRKVSCGCCSLGFVLGGTITVVLVLHVMDNYTAKEDMAGETPVIAGYSSTAAHSLLSKGIETIGRQINMDQFETSIERKTSEISKASLKYQTKEETSAITTNKDVAGESRVAGYSSTAAHSLLSEAFHTMEGRRKKDQSETTIQQRTSEFSKASLKYQTKEETSTITTNKEEVSHYTLLEDLDCKGNDIKYTTDATPQECARICDNTEGCVAFGYDKTNIRRYVCNFKNKCQHLSPLKNADTYLKGKDRIGRRVFDGKKSCYYIPLTAGSFDDMTTFCKKRNMQLVILETLQDYRLLANIIKRVEVQNYTLLDDVDCEGNGFISSKTAATPQECAGICRTTDAFIYDKRANTYMCKCKNKCQQLTHVANVDTYIKGRDHIGCGVFDGKKSCYYIPLISGNFDDMTKLCKKLNMQMVVLETWEEYKFISNIIKRGNMTIQMHISLKRISGTFYWIYPNADCVQLDYGVQRPWAPGEPGVSECVYFWALSPGKWDDYFCSEYHFTICEIIY